MAEAEDFLCKYSISPQGKIKRKGGGIGGESSQSQNKQDRNQKYALSACIFFLMYTSKYFVSYFRLRLNHFPIVYVQEHFKTIFHKLYNIIVKIPFEANIIIFL